MSQKFGLSWNHRNRPAQDALQKWEEQRSLACDSSTGNRREHEQFDLATYRREEEYAEFFDEGTVLPLGEFLTSQGFDPAKIGSESKQRRFVEEDMLGRSLQHLSLLIQSCILFILILWGMVIMVLPTSSFF